MHLTYIKDLKGFAETLTLLYVEDDEISRNETFEVLKLFFNNIVVAVDGKDGLEKYYNNHIDLIITDINMPNINGLDMIESIREENIEIPIFIVSAHNDTSFFLKSIKLGIDGFLVKPIESEMFIFQIFKSVKKIFLQKELIDYKEHLEEKVKTQVDEILHRDKMIVKQSKLAAMGEMIDVIAHQWKQPLGVINLNISLLIEEYEKFGIDVTYDRLKVCYERVNDQVKHLVDTLNSFRSFFRPSKDIEHIEAKSMVESVLNLMKDELISNKILVELDFENDINIKVNENEIKHIFINLINNAKDALVQNNIVKRVVKISARKEKEIVKLHLEDNAGGIPSELIENIFEANFTTKESLGGSGIGLYISNFIAKKNGADLSVENVQDGARFTLSF